MLDSHSIMIKGETILITGGAGFIGTALTERLCVSNKVVIFDNLHRDAITATGLLELPNVTLVQGDVTDKVAVLEVVKGCHRVVHMASIAGVDTVIQSPVRTMEVSILGTYNVLHAVKEIGNIRRMIDFSTSEVFGQYAYRVQEGDVTSLGAVGEARWTYAVSKLATEHLAYNYHKQYNIPTVAVRPFNVYGPRQVGKGAVHEFIIRALRNEDLVIHNDGGQIRAWCFIDDMVDAILRCLERDEAVGQTFNIGNPRSTITIYNLAREIVRLSNSQSKIRFIKWDFPDVELRVPDVEKSRQFLGFEPEIDLENGLSRTIEWYREELNR